MFIEKSINLTYFSFYSDCDGMCLDLPELPAWMTSATTYSAANSSIVSSHASPPTITSSAVPNNNSLRMLAKFKCAVCGPELRLPNLTKFMRILSIRCKTLKSIVFAWENEYDVDVSNYLREIISKQQQLKKIKLNADNLNIDCIFEALENTQRNSLVNMQIANVNPNTYYRRNFFESFCKLEKWSIWEHHFLTVYLRN